MEVVIPVSIIVIIFLYLGIPWIYSKIIIMSLRRKLIHRPSLVLTFDDGPGDTLTLSILDILGRYNAKATFFLLGRNISGREHIVRKIAGQGHTIGTHGFEHLNHWNTSPLKTIKDINRGMKEVDRALQTSNGIYPFRPPYGRLNLLSMLSLLLRKVPVIYWTCDVGDTAREITADSEFFVQKPANIMNGAVLLAHDYERKNKKTAGRLLSTIDELLKEADNKKLPVLTVSEFLRGSSN